MPRWWIFPPRAPIRLFFRRDQAQKVHYVVRVGRGIDPGLDRTVWDPLTPERTTWTASTEGAPPVPERRWRNLGGQKENLATGELNRRYRLLDCPAEALALGRNEFGRLVREHDGRRWIQPPAGAGIAGWVGDEIANPPLAALRFGSRAAWTRLARRMVAQSGRGQLSLDDDELQALATALVDPGRRPSFRPWTEDPAESQRLLLDEMRAALLAPAAEGSRPQWVEAQALERALPALGRPSASDPSLSLAASVAGVAGALRECRLAGAGDNAAWEGLFGGGDAVNCVLDARSLTPAEASDQLVRQAAASAGRVVGMLPGDPDHPDMQLALGEIARQRFVESILHLPPGALPGEEQGLALIAVGNRRPEPVGEAPPQALRVIRGEVRQDLRRWLDESLRGRGRVAGEEVSAARQAPYVPMSRIGQAKCTISRAHQVAAATAGRNLVARHGPVDEFVGGLLGADREGLESRYSPEQVDAIAMAEDAHRRGRAFLLGDQTGTGKGRSCAGMAMTWLRQHPAHRVLYMTLGNVVGDVLRDLRAVEALGDTGTPALLGNDLQQFEDAWTPAPAEYRTILDNRAFPDDTRFAVFTYSAMQQAAAFDMTRSAAERRGAEWFVAVANDPNTMVILDESQKALTPDSNLGSSIRAGIQGAGRLVFASATAMRTPDGVDLYQRLMPDSLRGPDFDRKIIGSLRSVGESAQESFISMLTEDGVLLRRDHDTGLVPYSVATPAEAEDQHNRQVMRQVAAVAEKLMEISLATRRWQHDAEADLRALAIQPGRQGRAAARTLSRMMTGGFGGVMDLIARQTLVALKVPQAARMAAAELRDRDRKPMISLQSTGGAFLERVYREEFDPAEGRPPGSAGRQIDLRDMIRDVASRACFVTGLGDVDHWAGFPVEDGRLDLRLHNDTVARLWGETVEVIEALTPGLPASPIDALRERLEGEGIRVGEITGRDMMLSGDGRVLRREKPAKRAVQDGYNSGEIDVLIYNEAGGTGASYHASAAFGDQRPRSILQLELPLDVLAHLQSMGRGNRYDQVALPDFITLSTDTLAEQRLLANNNRKLRVCGAILDGDRDHPALAREVPDLFNSLGQKACAAVLQADPALAARLDLNPNGNELAKSIFTRAILLPEREQDELFATITGEYDAQLAEADAQGRNPLKVPSLGGYVEITSTEPWQADDDQPGGDEAESVFHRPLMLSTGIWRAEPGLTAAAVSATALESLESPTGGGVGAATAMARELAARSGAGQLSLDEASARYLIELLEWYEPGRVLRADRQNHDLLVAVDYTPPNTAALADRPFAHRFRCIQPGDRNYQAMSAAELRLGNWKPSPGRILDEDSNWMLNRFDTFATTGRQRPVQVLSGDLLSVGGAMGRHGHDRGEGGRHYQVCTFNDQTGASRRAAVNTDIDKLDLDKLPFRISAGSVMDAALDLSQAVALQGAGFIPEGGGIRGLARPEAAQETADSKARTDSRARRYLAQVWMPQDDRPTLAVSLPPMSSKMQQSFWNVATGPELYKAMTGHELSSFQPDSGSSQARQTAHFRLRSPEQAQRARRVCTLLDAHPATDLLAAGSMRNWWRRRGQQAARSRARVFESGVEAIRPALNNAMAGGAPGEAARVSWPGGAVTFTSMPDAERPGAVVTLPPRNQRNKDFWEGDGGRAVWRAATGSPMPRQAPVNARPMTVFVEAHKARKIAKLLEARAATEPGWSLAVTRAPDQPPAAPAAQDRRPAMEMAG